LVEEEFALVDVADAGKCALVQQRLAEAKGAAGSEAAKRLGGVESGSEEVGAEGVDFCVVIAGDQSHNRRIKTDGHHGATVALFYAEDHDGTRLAAPPPLAGPVKMPESVHTEVRDKGMSGAITRFQADLQEFSSRFDGSHAPAKEGLKGVGRPRQRKRDDPPAYDRLQR
jgi:hypothetical protein